MGRGEERGGEGEGESDVIRAPPSGEEEEAEDKIVA